MLYNKGCIDAEMEYRINISSCKAVVVAECDCRLS